MASRTSVFGLLVLFIALCWAQENYHLEVKGDIKDKIPLNFTIPATNFETTATLTINHTVPVVICIQERYPLPALSQWNNVSCTFWHNFTNALDTEEFTLRVFDYHVGVYFGSTHEAAATVEVNLVVSGLTCHEGFYYDKLASMCKKADDLLAGWTNITVDANAAVTKFYTFTAPELTGAINYHLKTSAQGALYLRYNAAPSHEVHDASESSVGDLKFATPRPGVWVLALTVPAQHTTVAFDIHFEAEVCPKDHGFAGEGCNTPYFTAENNMTLVAYPGKYHYWIFDASPSLNVSVTTPDQKNLPHLYVSQGNLPTEGNADVSNCNQGFCEKVNSIRVNTTGKVQWFVSVTAPIGVPNVTFGIWFNTTCAPQCENDSHGTCMEDGTCFCQLDFTGIDCTISKGLGAQYIVLIIIASLVVASAIIGFVAWAYMRRKRVNYELVS